MATTKFFQALERVWDLGFTDKEQLNFIFADWPESEEHLDWLLAASKEEIDDWGEAANWGREDA